MQKIRVSPMTITKRDGQATQPATVNMAALKSRKESLQSRLRKIAKERMKDTPLKTLPQITSARRPIRRERSGKNQKDQGNRPWRYDIILQSAVCLVILLSVVTFRNIDTPVTNQISDGLSQAVSMDIDIGDNLGQLQFVQNIMPESVLTFWSATADAPKTLVPPMDGEVVVNYTPDQPGILIRGEGQQVSCAADGEVVSVREGQEGDFILRIRHDGGVETLYGFLQGVKIAPGDRVYAGQDVGIAMPSSGEYQVYFQAFSQDEPFDPVSMFPQ